MSTLSICHCRRRRPDREAGRHESTWRGTDQAGRAVPSGAYFARLLVDGEQAGSVAKMSLVR
ncbi:MAG: hypothetical protein GY838_09340 [bacterium]|nr:hypothetical protein [bacterium]